MKKQQKWPVWIFVVVCLGGVFSVMAYLAHNRDMSMWTDKVGTMYQIFVYSFADSDGDGVGDLQGITQKLDYLQELGVNGIWLTPIHSSQSYHKYDVEDYYSVDEQFGTLADFEQLVEESHKRGMKIVMDMVFNHTSDQHPWFLDVKTNQNSQYREYYALNDQSDDEFLLNGPWHKLNQTDYYYGYFGAHMPEVNLDNPLVISEWQNVLQFWLEKGVDGFRFDAVKHFYNEGELKIINDATQQAVSVLQALKKAAQKVNPQVYFVSEVWLGTSAMTPYYAGSDGLFQFDLATSMIRAVNRGETQYIKEYVENIQRFKTVNKGAISTNFLTNHDQTRVMSAVFEDKQRAKLAANLLLTLPGTSYIYYGEELGMTGMKPDERIREPFLWQTDGNGLQTSWESIEQNKQTPSVEQQQVDQTSMYLHYKQLINIRNTYPQLISGTVEIMKAADKFIHYTVENETGTVHVMHNLSKEACEVTLTTVNPQGIYGTIEGKTVKIAPLDSHIFLEQTK